MLSPFLFVLATPRQYRLVGNALDFQGPLVSPAIFHEPVLNQFPDVVDNGALGNIEMVGDFATGGLEAFQFDVPYDVRQNLQLSFRRTWSFWTRHAKPFPQKHLFNYT